MAPASPSSGAPRGVNRRRRQIAGAALAGGLLLVAAYAVYFCERNAKVQRDWDRWTAHLSGPPSSWVQPSNDFTRFQTERGQDGQDDALYGYKDSSGRIVIAPRFGICAERFYDGLAWAWDPAESRSGYIKPDGTWAVVLNGSTHSDFVGGMGEFQVIGRDGYPLHGFVNREGDVVVPARYRSVDWYVDGYVMVSERTWIGKITDGLGKAMGVFPKTCWDTRKLILDQDGRRSALPRR